MIKRICGCRYTRISRWRVRAGSSFRESGGTLKRVQTVSVHPDFHNVVFDASLVQVSSPFVFGASIGTVRLPAKGAPEPKPGAEMVITGWGRLRQVGKWYMLLGLVLSRL